LFTGRARLESRAEAGVCGIVRGAEASEVRPVATDAFFKPARIFNELDLFQRDPGWLAAFPDGCDESVVPRGEIYVSLIRERSRDLRDGREPRDSRDGREPRDAETPIWQIHADQWALEDENRPAVPAIPPAEILQLCIPYDPTSTSLGIETEPGADEGVLAFYTWAELRMTPAEAKDLLRKLCTRFQAAYPDREE
jgi:hypothetical protein